MKTNGYDPLITVFENLFATEPHYIHLSAELYRIRDGKSREKVLQVRAAPNKEEADRLKRQLPSTCLSGTFPQRLDEKLEKHSGYLVLDFDDVADMEALTTDLLSHNFIKAFWRSPRNTGLKVLVMIADGTKHREHFAALREIFPTVDRSGVNPSRVCFESYDPNIVIMDEVVPFKKITTVTQVEDTSNKDSYYIFQKILKWLSNRHDAFVNGERNTFVFKLAAALCRFGVDESDTESLILREFPTTSDFTKRESTATIKSAYRANKHLKGTAEFDGVLRDRVSRSEVEIEGEKNPDKLKDIVYGRDVKPQALHTFRNGHEFIKPVGIPDFDKLFKMRKGDITLFTGHGNYGKSMFKKWYQVLRAVIFDEKFASFPPEDFPVDDYYHELTEILLGCDCTSANPARPSEEEFDAAYDWISDHFFYIYPTDLSPTPEYVKQRFLELIISKKIDGCDIDPFNQMTNDYNRHGGRSDKYLETVLADFLRFAQLNNIYFWIIAHPVKMAKGKDGNYPCPDVYDVADGSMWNNKMTNILVYHRPFMQTEPNDPLVEFHTKKIKNQKSVGGRGFVLFKLDRYKRRYIFDEVDYLELALERKKLYFGLDKRLNKGF